jgi:PAS domain S-box-containing protein
MSARSDWARLFSAAFKQSKNAMVLLDGDRRQVDVNAAYLRLLGHSRDEIVGRPIYEFNADDRLSREEWESMLSTRRFTGEGTLRRADGSTVAVQWAATVEVVTGQRMILFVALNLSRWGRRFRRPSSPDEAPRRLSEREQTVVRLVALGNTGPEIAEELGIAHDTVRTHVRNAMTKVDARSRAHLVAKALGDGHVLS